MGQITNITGWLGKDPVVIMRDTKEGRKPVAKFSLATRVPINGTLKTIWWQVSAWDKRADLCARGLMKGDAVQLYGFASKGGYKHKQTGAQVDTLEFNAIFVTFLTNKRKQARTTSDPFNGFTPTGNPF